MTMNTMISNAETMNIGLVRNSFQASLHRLAGLAADSTSSSVTTGSVELNL